MAKVSFDADFEVFYDDCLKELKGRANYSDAFIPMLEMYVTITAKLATLNSEIVDEEIVVDHTNKAKQTNSVSSPKWRMFLLLNKEANALAKDLGLSPTTAPAAAVKKKKGFDLGSEMKVA
jgi:hypothetical protein